MTAMALDIFENINEGLSKFDFNKRLDEMNKNFKSSLAPEKGYFGESVIDKGNGFTEIIKRNDLGNISKDYFQNNQLVKNLTKIEDGWVATRYDDNQLAYLKEITIKNQNGIKEVNMELAPNAIIKRGNFTAETDAFGRPVFNEMADVQIQYGPRKALNKGLKDSSYLEYDDKGHIIADSLGGPPTKENIVAQMSEVNKGKISKVENIVRDYKAQGKKVDYSVKTNYVGENKRPSSFEPQIKVDGKEIELPKELKKIYNSGEESVFSKAKTVVGEKAALNNKAGLKVGGTAALITAAISTVDNVDAYMNGEISANEMALSIAKDTGKAGAIGYGTGFISSAVASATRESSHQLIRSLGKSNVPAAVITFGVTSYDTISDYAQGEIGEEELAIDLGENAVGVAGSFAGVAAAGFAAGKVGGMIGGTGGTVVPGAGNAVGAAVGFGAGFVGGMVGYAITTEAYKTVVDYIQENGEEIVDSVGEFASDVADKAGEVGKQAANGASELADKAQKIAGDTIEKAGEYGAEVASAVEDAIKDFNIANAIPW